jgi:hypothetical protein
MLQLQKQNLMRAKPLQSQPLKPLQKLPQE